MYCGKCGRDMTARVFLYGESALDTHAQEHWQDEGARKLNAGASALQLLIESIESQHRCDGLRSQRGCSCGLAAHVERAQALLAQWREFEARDFQ